MGRSLSPRSTWAASTSSRPRISMLHWGGRRRRPPASGGRSRSVRCGSIQGPDGVGDVDAAGRLGEAAVGRIFREESGRSVAALIGAFGDIDVAKDAVQEAL